MWIQFKIFIALFLGNATNGQKKTHTGKTSESGRGSSWGSTSLLKNLVAWYTKNRCTAFYVIDICLQMLIFSEYIAKFVTDR